MINVGNDVEKRETLRHCCGNELNTAIMKNNMEIFFKQP